MLPAISRPHKTKFVSVVAFTLVALFSYELSTQVQPANAIPAFARKYNFTCNVCHVPSFPKLNDFGNLFRDHGYQLGTDEDIPTHEGITMGYWPVSFRTTVGYQSASLRGDGINASTGSFGFTGLDILSFGLLNRHTSFGIVYTPGLASAGFQTGSTAGQGDLEAAFIRLNTLERFVGLGSDGYLMNLRVGKYELDVPFSEKRSPTLNTPFVMYHYQPGTPYTTSISGLVTQSAGYSNPNTFAIGDNQPGIELAGIAPTDGEGSFRYSLNAISNSNLNPNVNGGRAINYYGHLTQSFGGYGIVTGQRIGVFGAWGTAPTAANPNCPACPGTAGSGQPFSRIGVDYSLTFDGQWNLFGAWMHAHDSKSLFASQSTVSSASQAAWNGGFVELDWYPTQFPLFRMPGWLFTYRYDWVQNDRQGDTSFKHDYNDVYSHTFMARYNFHYSTRNAAALHAEYNTFRTIGTAVGGGDMLGQTLLVGIDFAY